MRAGLAPRDRALQLVCLHSKIDRVRNELEILTQRMSVRSGNNALHLPVARIHVDDAAGKSEVAVVLGPFSLHLWLAHEPGEITAAIKKCRIAGSLKVGTRDRNAPRRVDEAVAFHGDGVGDDVSRIRRPSATGGVLLHKGNVRTPGGEKALPGSRWRAAIIVSARSAQYAAIGHHRDDVSFGVKVIVILVIR